MFKLPGPSKMSLLARKSVLLEMIFYLLVLAAIDDAYSVCDSEEFKIVDECVCPGNTTAVYKCTAVGNGFTQWAGSAFNCPNIGNEIFLSHTDFNGGIRKECNNGGIIGQSLQVNGSCFTSQLTVNISSNLNGTTIGCTYDTGSTSTLETIGVTTLTSRTDSLSPPENVRLLDVSPEMLVFSWAPVPLNCSAVSYEIRSSCGECPDFTSSTLVTCIIQNSLIQDRTCSFAVRSVMCNSTVGGWSNEIEVMLRVPNPPMFNKISSRYDPRNLLGLDIQFSHLNGDSFDISNGIDGSVVHYTITFNNSITGKICASRIISPTSCSDVCVSSLPLSCFPLSGNIIVSVSATNVLGKGPINSIIIGNTNQYVLVTAESTDSGTITCTFLNQQDVQDEKLCSVLYGQCAEQLTSYSIRSSAGDYSVTVPLDIESDVQDYCYATIADNGTFSVLIEGSFGSTLSNDSNSFRSTLEWALPVIILLLVAVLSSIAYIVYQCRQFKKLIRITKCREDLELSMSSHNYNDTNLTEPSNSTRQQSQVPDEILAHRMSQSECHECFRAHVVFDLAHVPWELLSALKIFKVLDMNIADTRIIPVNETTKRIYIRFESDPSLTEIESIYKNRQEMNLIDLKVFRQAAEEFIDIHDETETKGCGVCKYKRLFPSKSGSLYKFLEGIKELSQKNSRYDLINIVRITVQPSTDGDGNEVIELQFVRELPSNWTEEFDKINLIF